MSDCTRSIYLEPAWKLPRSYDHLIATPPDGYRFVPPVSRQERLFKAVSKFELSYRILRAADTVVPPMLLIAWLQRRHKPPPGTDLTYAHGHLVFRPEPWVVEIEYPALLLGMDFKHLARCRRLLERSFASPHCRKIRCWAEAVKGSLTTTLDCEPFADKIAVVPHAVPPRSFTKTFDNGPIKLLFVGSANIKGEFALRGGWEVLEVFTCLRERYPDLKLVLRSDLPPGARARAAALPNVRIIDQVIPWEELELEFRTADIFILPTHSTPPFGLLDAMSFELPIVSLDVWANGEIVEHGRTGLLAQPSSRLTYYYRDTRHPDFDAKAFRRAIGQPDPAVVDHLSGHLVYLIENPDVRRRMGRAARWEVEYGRYSIPSRNAALGAMFDDALLGYGAHRVRREETWRER